MVRGDASSRDRCPATATSATSSATACCRPRSARCARRRWCPRRWPPATAARARRVCVVGTPCAARLPPGAVRGQPRRAGIDGARRSSLELDVDRADIEHARARAPFRRPGVARGVLRASSRCSCRPTSTSGCRRCSGSAIRTASGRDLEQRLGRRVFEIPTLPPSVPGMRLYEILRAALRARRRPARARRRGGVVRARRRARDGRSRPTPRAATSATWRRWFVLAAGGFALGRDRARLALGHARARARPAAARPARSRASRGSSATTWPSSRWPGSASRSTPSCAPRASENVLVAGRRAAGRRCRGARDRARGSRWPAAPAPPQLVLAQPGAAAGAAA